MEVPQGVRLLSRTLQRFSFALKQGTQQGRTRKEAPYWGLSWNGTPYGRICKPGGSSAQAGGRWLDHQHLLDQRSDWVAAARVASKHASWG
jgi:hypothetical protein